MNTIELIAAKPDGDWFNWSYFWPMKRCCQTHRILIVVVVSSGSVSALDRYIHVLHDYVSLLLHGTPFVLAMNVASFVFERLVENTGYIRVLSVSVFHIRINRNG